MNIDITYCFEWDDKDYPFSVVFYPAKIRVCHCNQCKFVKNKAKNRKSKKVINRLMNKKRRKQTDKVITHYWA